MRMKIQYLFLLVALSLSLLPNAMFAQAPGKHPAYLHAVTDLRWARGYLSQSGGNGAINNDASLAIQQIDAAIAELKKASVDDGKDLHSAPPVDAHLGNTDRFHKALELLDQAHADVSKEEDDPNARGLQARVLERINTAHRYIDHAISMKP